MNSNVDDWDEDLPPEPEEVYQDLVRALKRKSGFGLYFVQCTPVEADRLIAKLPQDIPQKHIEVLPLVEAIDNLYQRVAEFIKDKQVDILLIKGLEYSLYKYEKRTFGEITESKFSNLTSVPHILNNLNQQRERFRDDFSICFVFLLRSFSINYLIHRAPDFFDWRSGVFELPTTPELLEQESNRLILEGDYGEYLKLTQEQKIEKILEIQEVLQDKYQKDKNRTSLLFKLGNLFVAANEYQASIQFYDEAVKLQPDYYKAWYNRGLALQYLGHFEDSFNCFEEALNIKPEFDSAWNNRGVVLCDHLQRYEDALTSFEQAVYINPELHDGWINQGIALFKLGRFEQAIGSLDRLLKMKPPVPKAKAPIARKVLNTCKKANKVISGNKTLENFHVKYKLETLLSGVVCYNEDHFIPYLVKTPQHEQYNFSAIEVTQYWHKRLEVECPEQPTATKESIVRWLLGSNQQRFEDPKQSDILKQAMEYRWNILNCRYLGKGREVGYKNLLTRLGSLVTLRNKIQTWLALSRDRQRSVLDVLQEVIQELLQSDNYMQQQMAFISEFTTDPRLQSALLFASVEEYCLRPVRNQPLLIYRFVNYLRRTQRGGLTQVPGGNLIQLLSEDVLTENLSEDTLTENIESARNLLDNQAITEYQDEVVAQEQESVLGLVRQEFENYLAEQLGQEAVNWLRLYLQGQSQDAIAKKLGKPINVIYQFRKKVSYHAVHVFALKDKPELVEFWLKTSLKEHNLGLTPNQLQQLHEKLTPTQLQVLELRRAGNSIEDIAKKLKLKTHQAMGEWTKVYLIAQTLRNQE